MERYGEKWEIRVLLGTYCHALDDKGRIALPARLRAELGAGPYLCLRGMEGCLSVYGRSARARLAARLEELPVKNKTSSRAFRRALLADASELEPDEQGRILPPAHLLAAAGLRPRKSAVILGVDDRVEIWQTRRWKHYRRRAEAQVRRLASQLEI